MPYIIVTTRSPHTSELIYTYICIVWTLGIHVSTTCADLNTCMVENPIHNSAVLLLVVNKHGHLAEHF